MSYNPTLFEASDWWKAGNCGTDTNITCIHVLEPPKSLSGDPPWPGGIQACSDILVVQGAATDCTLSLTTAWVRITAWHVRQLPVT